jgi:hypothetical protein
MYIHIGIVVTGCIATPMGHVVMIGIYMNVMDANLLVSFVSLVTHFIGITDNVRNVLIAKKVILISHHGVDNVKRNVAFMTSIITITSNVTHLII